MILLNIPQGVVTFGSAVMAALVMIIGAAVGFALSVHGRVRALEANEKHLRSYTGQLLEVIAKTEILWDWYKHWAANLRVMGAPENPMKQERWNELADKLSRDEISEDETEEFLAALLRREEQAREEKDLAGLVILGSGIILAKWKLKEKELQEQFKEMDNRKKK